MPKLQPEPWLRGTHEDIAPVPRAALHAIELAGEDLVLWCASLSGEELHVSPFGLPSIAFQLRHIARSLDRLLTYAEGKALSAQQLAAITSESSAAGPRAELFGELTIALAQSCSRIRKFGAALPSLQESRTVGRKKLPTTVAGLLVHVADHTQRHVGQAITTAKIILARRADQPA